MRTFSSIVGRMVETESGRRLGRCRDLRAVLDTRRPVVRELVVGRRGRLEHLGIRTRRRNSPDAVPWEAVVRVEGSRIVVRDGTELV
ncbi:MAG TPA: PRC-barrel domain-containing protein [Gaiellaceae bacterium]|nr:PRC-barrel domain-containing protein [Gaiellaceae bacterium]